MTVQDLEAMVAAAPGPVLGLVLTRENRRVAPLVGPDHPLHGLPIYMSRDGREGVVVAAHGASTAAEQSQSAALPDHECV